MADFRNWTEIRRDLKNPLNLSDEELNDLIVEFMQRTNTFFDIKTLKRHLTQKQSQTLMENLGDEENDSEVLLRIEKDDYDRYNIYINPSEEELSNVSEENEKKSKPLITLFSFETPATVMLGIAKDVAETGMKELSDNSNGIVTQALNLPRQAILASLLEVVKKYEESNKCKDEEFQSLEHLGESSIKQDIGIFLRAASVLGTEFTAEEVRQMSQMIDVTKNETYRVIMLEDKSYRFINSRGEIGDRNINFSIISPKTFTRTLENALLRQEENYSHPYGSRLSNDDAKRLLDYTSKRLGQYQRGILIPEEENYFYQLKSDVSQLFNQPQENVNQILLEILRVTQTPFSLETILHLVPAGREKSFREAVEAGIGKMDVNTQFVISKIENPQDGERYGIRFRDKRVAGPDLIAFRPDELAEDLAKQPSLDAMESFLRFAEKGIDETILGDVRKPLLETTTKVLKRYLAMDENRDVVMNQLRRIDCLTEEEIKDLLAGILVMSQVVFIPNENRPEPFDTLFESDKKYVAKRGEDGNYYFKEQGSSKSEPRSWGLDEIHLDKAIPVLVSAMRYQMENPELKETEYLTVAGTRTVLAESIRVFGRYQETHKVKTGELRTTVADMSQDPTVVAAMPGAQDVVAKLANPRDKELLHEDK